MEAAFAALEAVAETLPRQELIRKLCLLLLKCRKESDLVYAQRLHKYIRENGLGSDASLGNFLVPLLAHVGLISDAQQVFDKLVHPTDCSWNFLIVEYAKRGKFDAAFILYVKMMEYRACPNVGTFVALLKWCSKMQDEEKGLELHAEICRKNLDQHPFVSSILVDMYAKCGQLAKAQEVFDNSTSQDVVTWTALISGYVKQGDAKRALSCFETMRSDGINPTIATFLCCLKSCGCLEDIVKGQAIHAEIARRGFGDDLFIGSSLIDVYVKFHLLNKAQDVFNKLPVRDTVSYNALIAGYATQGCGEDAVNYFDLMQREGLACTNSTYASILKACGSILAIDKAHSMHINICRKGLQDDSVIGNALIDMYVALSFLESAQNVFEAMPIRDIISWTALIGGHAKQGYGEEALKYLEAMQLEGIQPNLVTLVCGLIACNASGDIEMGESIHSEAARRGFVEDLSVGSTLVDMYAKCGSLAKAQEIFYLLKAPDVVCWNALLGAYSNLGYDEEVLHYFEEMQLENLEPDMATVVCCLKGCANLGDVKRGLEIHDISIQKGLLKKETVIANALIEMYVRCGFLANAMAVFERLLNRDVMSWNAVLAGYIQNGQGKAALGWFERMHSEGVSHDVVTFVCALKGCSITRRVEKGEEIHGMITQRALETDLLVGNALIDMYANAGLLHEAQGVFDRLSLPDVVSWTSLLSGLTKHGYANGALDCFEQMRCSNLVLDALVSVCVLKACSMVGGMGKGQILHSEIVQLGFEADLVVANSLIDMYTNCGMLMEGSDVFWRMPLRDVVSYTSLLSGYAQSGEMEGVRNVLNAMARDQENPNPITFISILNACSHSGIVDVAQGYLEAMEDGYEIVADLEHFMCMIDVFGRAGQLDKAVAIAEKMPFHPNVLAWHSVLGACRKWNDADLGERVFENAISLDENDAALYICMHNIYADANNIAQSCRNQGMGTL